MRRPRTCPAGARTAIFVEGGDEERLCRAILGPGSERVFWMTFDGNTAPQIRARVQGARSDPGWEEIRNVGVILDAEEAPDQVLPPTLLRRPDPAVCRGG